MDEDEMTAWLQSSRRRGLVLEVLARAGCPMTATQLSAWSGLLREVCSYLLWELSARRLARCVNPRAVRYRLYGLTRRGRHCARGLGVEPARTVSLDWSLHGELLFSHRSAVVRDLAIPMQPCEIKRRIRLMRPGSRISANNVRDVLRDLLRLGIARRSSPPNTRHPSYTLTDTGRKHRELLLRSGVTP